MITVEKISDSMVLQAITLTVSGCKLKLINGGRRMLDASVLVKGNRCKSESKIQQPLYLFRGCCLLVRKHSTIVLIIVQSCKFI